MSICCSHDPFNVKYLLGEPASLKIQIELWLFKWYSAVYLYKKIWVKAQHASLKAHICLHTAGTTAWLYI